jgi:hypothetical protein
MLLQSNLLVSRVRVGPLLSVSNIKEAEATLFQLMQHLSLQAPDMAFLSLEIAFITSILLKFHRLVYYMSSQSPHAAFLVIAFVHQSIEIPPTTVSLYFHSLSRNQGSLNKFGVRLNLLLFYTSFLFSAYHGQRR